MRLLSPGGVVFRWMKLSPNGVAIGLMLAVIALMSDPRVSSRDALERALLAAGIGIETH